MARYAIGIDLGTTHSALSYFNLEEGKARGAAQSMLPIPQLTAPGTVEAQPLLPSFLYLPSGQEFPHGQPGAAVEPGRPAASSGEFARSHGAKVPTRLVSSAKSWLCHPGVDRRAALLPWQAPEEVQRVSPLEASARYLRHLREAWDHAFAGKEDAGSALAAAGRHHHRARLVRRRRARPHARGRAGRRASRTSPCSRSRRRRSTPGSRRRARRFRKQVKVGDVILVVDVGGGTTDFSLIAVRERDGERGARAASRWATTSCSAATTWTSRSPTRSTSGSRAEGKKLDAWQFNALTYACRRRRSTLFADADAGQGAHRDPGPRLVADRRHAAHGARARGAGPRCSPTASSRSAPVTELPAHGAPHRPRADGAAVRAGRRR